MAQQALGEVFISALSRFRKMGASYPGTCELQLVEWTILQKVAAGGCAGGEGCCLNVTEIQQTLHISRPGVSQSLSSLERKGYILRRLDSADRRKIAVTVTPAGQQKLAESCCAYQRMMEALTAEFGAEDMLQLCQKLNALADVYDRLVSGAEGEPR